MNTPLTYEGTRAAVATVVARTGIPLSGTNITVAVTEDLFGVRYEHQPYRTAIQWVDGRVSRGYVNRALAELHDKGIVTRLVGPNNWGALTTGTVGWITTEKFRMHQAAAEANKVMTREVERVNALRARAQRIVLHRHADEVDTILCDLMREAEVS